MTLVVDAAPLVAVADTRDRMAGRVGEVLAEEDGPLVLPAPVSAEVDYLLGRRFGHKARHAFLADLAAGRFIVPCLEPSDYATARELDERYVDLGVGLAELSIVILAERFRTTRILTFDERGFRALRPLHGDHFVLLPADA